jgi:hypothetical protein
MFFEDVFRENLRKEGLNLMLLEGRKNACFWEKFLSVLEDGCFGFGFQTIFRVRKHYFKSYGKFFRFWMPCSKEMDTFGSGKGVQKKQDILNVRILK